MWKAQTVKGEISLEEVDFASVPNPCITMYSITAKVTMPSFCKGVTPSVSVMENCEVSSYCIASLQKHLC